MRTRDLPGGVCAPSLLCSTPMLSKECLSWTSCPEMEDTLSIEQACCEKHVKGGELCLQVTWRPLFREDGGVQLWCEHGRLTLRETSSTRPHIALYRANSSAESWAILSPLTPEAAGDAGAAASHRKTATFNHCARLMVAWHKPAILLVHSLCCRAVRVCPAST